MAPKPPLPALTLPDAQSWTHWLTQNAASSPGVWLTLARKNNNHTTTANANTLPSRSTTLTAIQALEEALCHGWIDSQSRANAADDSGTTFVQRFTPRVARGSMWSQRNVAFAERLEREGRMREAGRDVVERAKRDGSWVRAYGSTGAVEGAPEDLRKAVVEAGVLETWEALKMGERYAFHVVLAGLRSEEGRERRIREYVEGLKGVHGEKRKRKRMDSGDGVDGIETSTTTATATTTTTTTTTRSGRKVKKPQT